METYSFYFREYANSDHTIIQRVDGSATKQVKMTQPNMLILAGDGATLLEGIIKLAPYGIEKIQYMHPAESEVIEEVVSST